MAHGDFKDLSRRIASDKVLRDQEINIAKNPKYYGYERDVTTMVYKFFDKKFSGAIETEFTSNQKLAEELQRPIFRKFEKQKVYSSFKDNTWGANLVDMQLKSKYNKGFLFLLWIIDIYSK